MFSFAIGVIVTYAITGSYVAYLDRSSQSKPKTVLQWPLTLWTKFGR